MKNLYLVRHGDIGLGRDKRYIGIQDLPLSAEGKRQAVALKDHLAQMPLDRIYCSKLTRSQETAAIIALAHTGPLPIIPLPNLHEIAMGEWEGKLFSEIREQFPLEFRLRGEDIVNYRPPGGESFHDCFRRIVPVFECIVQSDAENILIVGHAGVNRVILSHVLQLPLEKIFDIEQSYGCLYILTQDSSGGWELKYIRKP